MVSYIASLGAVESVKYDCARLIAHLQVLLNMCELLDGRIQQLTLTGAIHVALLLQ